MDNVGGKDKVDKDRVRAEIEFSSFSADDLSGISHLISDMSSDGDDLRLRDKSAAYYRWMYYDNPAGAAFGCLAKHGERVVSSFAVAPKVMQVGGRIVRVGKTMDMFTDPEYQGLGLIKQCADRVFAEAREAGIDGWYVTPSVNSYPIFKNKWGYREDFEIVFRTRILEYGAVVGKLVPRLGALGRLADRALGGIRRSGPRTDGVVVELDRFDERTDALWRRVAPGYGVAIVRSAEYMNWRYVDNPDEYVVLGLQRGTELDGILVMKVTRRQALTVGEIVDVVCPADRPRTLRALLHIAAARCRELGCALVEAWSIRGTAFDHRLMLGGLALPRTRVKFLVSPDYPDPMIYDKRAWLLAQGDGNDV